MDERQGRRKRLPRDEREKLILDEAVRFFAEVGFDGQTRALAERLGVTQPLLYRYFPDKETLIERVFDEIYLKRWHPEWEILLQDRQRPLVERLVEFYRNYCSIIFRPEWVRIFMFAGLKGEAINARYLDLVQGHILKPICTEFRAEAGLPSPDSLPIDDMEISAAWSLHGAVAYIAVRKYIYRLPVPGEVEDQVAETVLAFSQGCGETIRKLVSARLTACETAS